MKKNCAFLDLRAKNLAEEFELNLHSKPQHEFDVSNAHDEPITSPKKKFGVNFFTKCLEHYLSFSLLKFEQVNEYSYCGLFLNTIKII